MEKKIKNKFKMVLYDVDGFNEDGFNRKGFDRKGFNINGIDENGFNRSKEVVCDEKIEEAKGENSWNIYYVKEVFRNKNDIMKECVRSHPNTYQNATFNLKKKMLTLLYVFLSEVVHFL